MEWLIAACVLALIALHYMRRHQKVAPTSLLSPMQRAIKLVPGVRFKHELVGAGESTAVAIDETGERIHTFSANDTRVARQAFPFACLISCEVFEDGHTVSSTSRMSQLAGVAVGGALLGSAGAIIGGLSGKTKTMGMVNRIELRMAFDNMSAPLHTVVIFNGELSRGSQQYQDLSALAREWASRLEIAMRKAAPSTITVKK